MGNIPCKLKLFGPLSDFRRMLNETWRCVPTARSVSSASSVTFTKSGEMSRNEQTLFIYFIVVLGLELRAFTLSHSTRFIFVKRFSR
jgi:hypothetical protein